MGTTPTRIVPAALGATAGVGGAAAFGAEALSAGLGVVVVSGAEAPPAAAPPIVADTSWTLHPGGASNMGASRFVLVSSTTSVVVVKLPCPVSMLIVCLSG